VDTVTQETWQRVNKPHGLPKLGAVLQGILRFAETFDGELTTETMLVQGINCDLGELDRIAGFLASLKPDRAYLAIPTRPPAARVEPAGEEDVNAAYQVFAETLSAVECLIGYEGNAFACTGDAEEDLLSITAVHPMQEEAVADFLTRAGAGWDTVRHLVEQGDLIELHYRGKRFYLRRLPSHGLARP